MLETCAVLQCERLYQEIIKEAQEKLGADQQVTNKVSLVDRSVARSFGRSVSGWVGRRVGRSVGRWVGRLVGWFHSVVKDLLRSKNISFERRNVSPPDCWRELY